MDLSQRRPLKTRSKPWAMALADWCVNRKISPNFISLLSMVCAALAATFLLGAPQAGWMYAAAAVCIQLRLLCNMLDGMVAVGSGAKSKAGDLFNEIPDRIADALILAGAGYSLNTACGAALGWGATFVAVMTAYIRALGATIGAKQYFLGPMAKPHRMALMTGACIAEMLFNRHGGWIAAALIVVVAGGVVTCIRRVRCILREFR